MADGTPLIEAVPDDRDGPAISAGIAGGDFGGPGDAGAVGAMMGHIGAPALAFAVYNMTSGEISVTYWRYGTVMQTQSGPPTPASPLSILGSGGSALSGGLTLAAAGLVSSSQSGFASDMGDAQSQGVGGLELLISQSSTAAPAPAQ